VADKTVPTDGAGPADAAPKKPPPRPIDEVVRDLEQERRGLVDALDDLKSQARSTKERFLSRRTLIVAGGAIVGLFVLVRVLKSALRSRRS
jgi:hypothetical protein